MKNSTQKTEENISILLAPQPFRINKIRDFLIAWISIPFWTYILLCAYFGPPDAYVYRSIFVTFILVLSFLSSPLKKDMQETFNIYALVDIVLILAALFIQIYILWDYRSFQLKMGSPDPFDMVVGFMQIILIFEAARRLIGWTIVTVSGSFIILIYYASSLPGVFRAPSVSPKMIIATLFMGFDGIFGIPIGIISSMVALFILFGSLLLSTKVSDVFMDLSLALAGKSPGGPAKVAVISSGLTGTISGSGVANVLTTGSFTIPLMKKTGYTSVFAGAVEAVASTGGMLMPPVMGAAAFIIAEFLGIRYIQVCKAALIPALLYYFSCFMAVHLRAKKSNLKGLPLKDIPQIWFVIKNSGYMLLPLFIIIVLLVQGFTPTRACLMGLSILFIFSFFKKENRLTPITFLRTLEQASRDILSPGIGCACAGIIVGCVFIGGMGPKFVTIILAISQGKLFLMLFFTALTSIILGMGLTATAVYITVFFVSIPALVRMGVTPVGAHLFAFFFGIISGITPPVAITAFAAAGLSGASINKTGWTAFLIGLPTYIVPFVMIYFPGVLMVGTPLSIIYSLIVSVVAICFISFGTIGYLTATLNLTERIALVSAGILVFFHGWYILVGIAIFLIVLMVQIKSQKKLIEGKG